LTLAFSGTFWSQAVIAEVYAPHVFFATLLLYGALQVRPANAGWLVPVLFGLLGVSLGNHFSILFLFPMLIWVLKARWRWRLIVATLLAFCCGLLVFVLLPFRAAAFPPVNWGMATTWPNFLWLVSAEPYRQYLFAAPWEIVPVRIGAELYLLAKDFMGWGIPVGLLGWLRLIQVNPSMAYSGLLTYFLFSIYAIGYNTTDSYIYLLPAFFIFTLWLGWGLYDISTVLQKLPLAKFYRASLIGGGFIFLPLLSLLLNFSGQNIRGDEEAYTYAQQSLQQVAPGAIIVTDSDRHTFTLWYSRYGLALRSDVAIVNSNLLIYAWYRQTLRQTHPHLRLLDQAGRPLTTCSAFMEQNISHSPIYLTSPQCPTPAGYRLEPGSPLQRVVRLNSG
jgi:hypothetical protein